MKGDSISFPGFFPVDEEILLKVRESSSDFYLVDIWRLPESYRRVQNFCTYFTSAFDDYSYGMWREEKEEEGKEGRKGGPFNKHFLGAGKYFPFKNGYNLNSSYIPGYTGCRIVWNLKILNLLGDFPLRTFCKKITPKIVLTKFRSIGVGNS
jgi:hypothetical protein